MPAFAIVTVCCSITSWIATLSASFILSNSSIHTTPRSAKTIAPASNLRSPLSWSVVTAAVKPTPEEPLPVVLTAYAATPSTHLNSCDLATEGSPTIRQLISPRMWVPFFKFFSLPPRSRRMRALLMFSCPHMEGAKDFPSSASRVFGSSLLGSSLIFLISSWCCNLFA